MENQVTCPHNTRVCRDCFEYFYATNVTTIRLRNLLRNIADKLNDFADSTDSSEGPQLNWAASLIAEIDEELPTTQEQGSLSV